MLTTFLDRLGSLVSRQFVMGYFVPVLVFGFLNALLLGWQVETFRAWASSQFEGFKGFYAVPVLVGLSVVAYLMLSINVYLRQVLEGRRLLPARVLLSLAAREQMRRDAIMDDYEKSRNQFHLVSKARGTWREQLVAAGNKGYAHPRKGAAYDEQSPAAVKLAALAKQRRTAEAIPYDDLDTTVSALSGVLEVIDRDGTSPAAARLAKDYDEILDLIDYAEGAWDVQRIAALNRLQTLFGVGEMRATRMGNVAAALESYAQTRYRMNLDTFWNRMQPVLQANDKFYGMLVDAKTQLDFLVLSCWLCMLTAAAWMVAMPWLRFSWAFYLTVALLVPGLARFFYELAVENYLTFADIVKSAVDLFRFQLLKSLHVPPPTGIRQERALWASLQDLSTFGTQGPEISYQHDGP